jgi:hypothetical protein
MSVLFMAEMTIQQFIKDEMERKHITSAREFGRKSDIHPKIINAMRNGTPRAIEIDTLRKLSDFTGTSLMTLIGMVYPEAAQLDIDVDTRLTAERIRKLPPNKQDIARGYITDAYTEGDDEQA